jgi:nicotinate-nucleotide pyrophosphorylase (carboxylating)
MQLNKRQVSKLIKTAIDEDLGGYGDITSALLISGTGKSEAHIVCKQKGGAVLSGIDIAGFVFEEFNAAVVFEKLKSDGRHLETGDIVCRISGPSKDLLAAERTALNFIQHLSGIATATFRLSSIASKYNIKIADTRKTKPGLRKIEKYAVTCGGGFNHRFGLSDGVLIKDNHIIAAGGIEIAIEKARKGIPHQLKIEVEVKDFDQLDQAIRAGADIIMLDNMSVDNMHKAVNIIRSSSNGSCLIEASGNVREETIEDICKTGVDIISCGYITHSAPAVDFSMEFE